MVDQLFARVDGEGQFWLTGDYLGSVRDVLDDTGAVVYSARYGSFGGIAAEDGAGELGRYQWTGREIDAVFWFSLNWKDASIELAV